MSDISDVNVAWTGPSLSVFALDDDADFREYLAGELDADGHAVRTFATPAELFVACEAHQPHVLLLDMHMGAFNGKDVLSEVRRRWPKLCVIIVTGYPSLEGMRQTFKQDVFDYISKPFSMNELRRALGQAVADLDLGRRPQDKLRAELGKRIRLARSDKGWTLKELSEASGVSVSQLSAIERGTHLPSLESLVAVSQALEAKPSRWLDSAGL
jgi:DNA-binding NtrC family response regulator